MQTKVNSKENKKAEREERRLARQQKYQSRFQDAYLGLKEIITGNKVYNSASANEFVKKFSEFSTKEEVSRHSRYSMAEKVIFIILGLTLLNTAILLGAYIYAFSMLNKTIFCNSALYVVPAVCIPYITWVRATNENFWAFHRRKRLFFSLASINAVLVLLQLLYSLCWKIAVPLVMRIKPNPCLTEKMITFLVYIFIFALFFMAFLIVYRQFEPVILSDTTKRQIELFKFQQIKDNRENREYCYDITTIKDLDTGKSIRIKENDRFVQTDINGASGTGKTSSIFLNVIRQDMDTKFKNREKRQEEFRKLIQEGKATIAGPLKIGEFQEKAVVAAGKTEKEKRKNAKLIESIRKKYPDCGITVMAPNPSLNDELIRLAQARHFQVNVLDPTGNYTHYKNVRNISMNPFFLPFGLSEEERVIRIMQAASNFADVLIATNQMGGQSDVYFTDISLSVSSNIAAVVMLAKNIKHQQAYIDDVHECISDFSNLTGYVRTIEEHYGITVTPSSTKLNQAIMAGGNSVGEREARKNPYYQQILFVKQELLGDGKEAMFSQARGLRNLITKILQDPRIKSKLSAKNEDRLDFDSILANNDITLVSTAIELGQNISTSFGLFFLLQHRTAVLRRPKETRTPHFLWVDECAQYVHPVYDDIIALYRQYRVAAVLTLQTLTQLEKHKATAYLKNVFLGAGTHIVFGRLAVEEMRMYSEMAGITREMQEQKSSTQNSVLASNPNYTESTRYTPTITNNMEGADMRLLDFQELTIFTIDNGRVLPGKYARVFFIREDAYDEKPYNEIAWERLVPEAFRETPDTEDEPVEAEETNSHKMVKMGDKIQEEDEDTIMIRVDDTFDMLEEEKKEKIETKNESFDDLYNKLLKE